MAENKRDYYEVLGLTKGASDDEIKRAVSDKISELDPNYFVVMTVDRV